MQEKTPDPRWKEFVEERDKNGKIIGFKLPGNDYLYEYDEFGGWADENGKLYDAQGYLIEGEFQDVQDDQSEDSADIDDDIVDDFEQMLIEEEQGIIRNKKKPSAKTQGHKTQAQDMETEMKKYIEKLKKGDELREGLTPIVWIFYKMKSSQYEKINPEVQKQQDLNSKNNLIKQIKATTQEKRNQLLGKNQWLKGDFLLDFSGVSEEEGHYERYWYGWIKVNAEDFFTTLEQIKKSKQFSLLKSKTLYALKSKFYLKHKMQETIKELRDKLKDVPENEAVLVKINNLPEQFPISLIIDLVELSGGNIEDIEDIDIVDNFSADMIAKKRTAQLFTNIEGYPHEEHEYTWIEVEPLKRQIKYHKLFNIEIEAAYKIPIRQTADTLALEFGANEIAKVYEKGESFRLAVGQGALRRVLMFRGETLNAVRVVRFEKKA